MVRSGLWKNNVGVKDGLEKEERDSHEEFCNDDTH